MTPTKNSAMRASDAPLADVRLSWAVISQDDHLSSVLNEEALRSVNIPYMTEMMRIVMFFRREIFPHEGCSRPFSIGSVAGQSIASTAQNLSCSQRYLKL